MRIDQPQETARRRARWLSVILLAAFGALFFATSARASDCQTVTFEAGYITSRSGNDQTIRTGLIGKYLNVQVGEYTGQTEQDVSTFSVDVPVDAVAATVCPDSTVSFVLSDPAPVPVVVDTEPTTTLTDDPQGSESEWSFLTHAG